MISLNKEKIKHFLNQNLDNVQELEKNIDQNIENIQDSSDKLEIISITKLDTKPIKTDIIHIIKAYESIGIINDYSTHKCPCCKNNNCMKYHKDYQRNITFIYNDYLIEAKISLIVLECSFCKEVNKGKQKYHTLLPEIIFPYHIYSSEIIMNTLNDRFINKLKIEQIIEKRKISAQLYYKWLKGLFKYLPICSIILECKIKIEEILLKIKLDKDKFYNNFYEKYFHPFFLFKKTCVPLAIMP